MILWVANLYRLCPRKVGLFTNVSSGIADVFYEPYKGVVMHGNKELGIGIAKVR
jgi:hypothetical protein